MDREKDWDDWIYPLVAMFGLVVMVSGLVVLLPCGSLIVLLMILLIVMKAVEEIWEKKNEEEYKSIFEGVEI